jgi:hypothetical protein
MENLNTQFFGITLTTIIQIATGMFFAITFLQSSLDKLFDYKGNKDYLTDHFKNSILASSVPVMMPLITVMEFVSGSLALTGIFFTAYNDTRISIAAAILAMITFLSLFLGQRVAKDYAGASGIIPYLIFTLISLLFF